MAQITRYPVMRHFRAEASSEVRVFRHGKTVRAGRGLAFWFDPARVSIAEVPLADRELTFMVRSQSADFQDLAAQGTIIWSVVDVDKLAERVDFAVDLTTGAHLADPQDHINRVLNGLAREFADSYIKKLGVRALLEAGLAPLQAQMTAGFAAEPTLAGMGIRVATVRVAALTPSSELARALQAPTFESLQQKADEAGFNRRALAVEKERAIAENELANQIELASRRASLIEREDANARAEAEGKAAAARIRVEGEAQVKKIAAEAEALKIRAVEQAQADMEAARMAAISKMDPTQLFALAAREMATKLDHIDSVTVTPDMVAGLMRQLGLGRPAAGA